ncbi:hypothetical protein LIER_13515 [Lithospermum erythrorhizon]|uniref:Retrotransposon gag domain-containing protein n=1 Tax=Lithospermum erythrorhizon TaxID=34254 RepID=A0AAV3PVU4_LITER
MPRCQEGSGCRSSTDSVTRAITSNHSTPNCDFGQAMTRWWAALPPANPIVADEDERTLMEIQQNPGETLRSYATRFEEAATNIPSANEKVTMISFFHGLRYGPLKEKRVLESFNVRNELLKLVIQYIRLEEVKTLLEEMAEIRGKKVADEGTHRSPKRTRVWDRLQKPREKEPFKRLRVRSLRREERRIRKPQEPMFNNYTPLRTTVGRVNAQVEDKRIFSRPQKIKALPNRTDQKKYCEYHNDHGQDTDECRVLKEEIERLVRRGHLKEFVKNDRGGSPRRPRELSPRQNPRQRQGVIRACYRGSHEG